MSDNKCSTYDIKTLLICLPPANEVWGKVMFLHLCVILFTGEGSTWGGVLHPGGRLHRGVDLHPGGSAFRRGLHAGVGRPPYWMLRDTVNERAVHILLECILV